MTALAALLQPSVPQRLRNLAEQRPLAAELATLASLAVRVDSALLRALRLRLLPQADAGTEADVWFAGLSDSQGSEAFVFEPGLQALLRQALAVGGQLEAAWQVTQAQHRHWPASLQLEEALTHLALGETAERQAGRARMARLLRPALKAMAQDGTARAQEVARWALRALPRLPPPARRHPDAQALLVAAVAHLGTGEWQLAQSEASALPPLATWLMSQATAASPLRLQVLAQDNALTLSALAPPERPAPGGVLLQLPATQPVLAELRIEASPSAPPPRLQVLHLPSTLPLPQGWKAVQLTGLDGMPQRIERLAGGGRAELPPWVRQQVRVLRDGRPSGMAFFVSPSQLVTVIDTLPETSVRALQAGKTGIAVELTFDSASHPARRLHAQLMLQDPASPLALLRLGTPLSEAAVVPWQETDGPDSLPTRGTYALSAGVDAPPGEVMWTQFDGIAREPPKGLPPQRAQVYVETEFIRLRVKADLQAVRGLACAPVCLGSRFVGLVDLATAGRLYALPAERVRRFVHWADMAREQWPRLYGLVASPRWKASGVSGLPSVASLLSAACERAHVQLQLDAGLRAGHVAVPPLRDSRAGIVLDDEPSVRRRGFDERSSLLLRARHWSEPSWRLLELNPLPGNEPGLLLGGPAEGTFEPLALSAHSLGRALARELIYRAPPADAWPETQRALLLWVEESGPGADHLIELIQAFADGTLARKTPTWLRPALKREGGAAWVQALATAAMGPLPSLPALPEMPVPLALVAQPMQLARLLLHRSQGTWAGRPCLLLREHGSGPAEPLAGRVQTLLVQRLIRDLKCTEADALWLSQNMPGAYWVVRSRSPDAHPDEADRLGTELPGAVLVQMVSAPQAERLRWPHVVRTGLPEDGTPWVMSYKRLMDWAAPRPAAKSATRSAARRAPRPRLK